MDKKLQKTLSPEVRPETLSDNQILLREIEMEQSFAAEIELMKKNKLDPRPEAVEHLLQLISKKSLAESH